MPGVRNWPVYNLHRQGGMPAHIREQIEQESEAENMSMAEVVRRILCAHWQLECEPVEQVNYPRPEKRKGTQMMIVRVQPELFSAIKDESIRDEVTMKALIIGALEAHYNGGTPA